MYQTLGWMIVAAGALTLAVGAIGAFLRLHRPRRWCAGAPRGWARWMPTRLVWARRCGYDLTGIADGDRCPECGRAVSPGSRLRRAGPVRLSGVVVASVLVAAGCLAARNAVRKGWYVRVVPTPIAVLLERPGPALDFRLEREITRRADRQRIHGWSADHLARAAADELEAPAPSWGPNDNAYYDFKRARHLLGSLWPASRPHVERLLTSKDWSARCFAVDLLREHLGDDPTPELLTAAVDQLRDDSAIGWRYYHGWNATASTRYLMDHAPDARQDLEAALDAEDDQLRTLAATVLLETRTGDRFDDAAAALVESLRSNATMDDAQLAALMLWRSRELARPALADALTSDDPQQATWAWIILERADCVPWKRLEPLARAYPLSTATADPLEHPMWAAYRYLPDG